MMKNALGINLLTNGYEIVEDVYSSDEISQILQLIESKEIVGQFGVREFLQDHPDIKQLIFTNNLVDIIKTISSKCHKAIKSIYFDKPPNSNWVVNWHQDLTINLTHKIDCEGYKNWRVNTERTIVQPAIEMLESIFTIRIHLDDCTKENGALRVIEKSHQKGVIELKEWISKKEGIEKICEVKKGGILILKPLTLHASKRTENQKNRRVIHIEFTDQELPKGMNWNEKLEF